MKKMRYPVSSRDEWTAYPQLSAYQRATIAWRDYRRRRRARKNARTPELTLVSGRGPDLSGSDIPLILCMRNGTAYIDLFLDHYRRLGVERFIIVDDGSTDSGPQRLKNCPDVDLYVSGINYTEAGRGQLWRDALFDLYGRDRWYVSVDIDEFLLFPGCETRKISDYCRDLERHGSRRGLAPMLDTYPDGPLSLGELAGASSLIDVTPMIDGANYDAIQQKYGVAIMGGPRSRLYGNEIRLTKFPVVFADENTQYFGASIHSPFPLLRNYQPVTGVLLHLKFTASSVDEFKTFIAEGRHFGGSQFYRQIVESSAFGTDADLRFEGSRPWRDSTTLLEAGFMKDLRSL